MNNNELEQMEKLTKELEQEADNIIINAKQLIDSEYLNNNHSSYYGGKDNVYETIKVINAWSKKNNWDGEQGFTYGTVLRYLSRAGHKKGNSEAQDIQKCINYLQMRLDNLL